MCLNETCELTDEGDTTNQNAFREDKTVNSLRTKSVLSGQRYVKDADELKPRKNSENITNSNKFNDSLSSLESIGKVDGPTSTINTKGILDMYNFNPSKGM